MKSKIEDSLALFGEKNVLVIGDLMLDEFVRGKVERISPEAPVPIVEVQDIYYTAGGAGNVALNLAAVGVGTYISGIVGIDERAKRLLKILNERHIDTKLCLRLKNRPTILKQRIIAHSQQMVRVDYETKEPIDSKYAAKIYKQVFGMRDKIRAIIISDYGKGMITAELMERLIELRKEGIKIVVDPKKRNYDIYRNIDVVTPNEKEASEASRIDISDERSLRQAGNILLEKWHCKAVLITRGPQGMALFERDKEMKAIKTFAREVYDVTGAGDTVVSFFTAGLISGLDYYEAALLANIAAGIVVGKVGTATVSKEEIKKELELWEHEIK